MIQIRVVIDLRRFSLHEEHTRRQLAPGSGYGYTSLFSFRETCVIVAHAHGTNNTSVRLCIS